MLASQGSQWWWGLSLDCLLYPLSSGHQPEQQHYQHCECHRGGWPGSSCITHMSHVVSHGALIPHCIANLLRQVQNTVAPATTAPVESATAPPGTTAPVQSESAPGTTAPVQSESESGPPQSQSESESGPPQSQSESAPPQSQSESAPPVSQSASESAPPESQSASESGPPESLSASVRSPPVTCRNVTISFSLMAQVKS